MICDLMSFFPNSAKTPLDQEGQPGHAWLQKVCTECVF